MKNSLIKKTGVIRSWNKLTVQNNLKIVVMLDVMFTVIDSVKYPRLCSGSVINTVGWGYLQTKL